MSVTVLVEQANGQFCASLVGSSALQAVRPSRDEAIRALQGELTARAAAGELVDLELGSIGVSGLAGMFRDDPELSDICEAIYQERDAQRLP